LERDDGKLIEDHGLPITPHDRVLRSGHAGAIIWLTGLSGAGKSTLARILERRLFESGAAPYVLDGDELRHGLNADLGYSDAARSENVRRVGHVAALFADAGMICITALISPFAADRERARAAARGKNFWEVFLDADVVACERRDPKGLYRAARRGELLQFTGVSSPYEVPLSPDLVLHTASEGIAACADELTRFVMTRCSMKVAGQ